MLATEEHDSVALRPSDFAGETENVEQSRIVPVDTRGKDVPLPCLRRDGVAFELLQHFSQTVRPRETARDVLPGEEEALEIRCTDRLDLGAQPPEGVAMDAREQPAIAPFEL